MPELFLSFQIKIPFNLTAYVQGYPRQITRGCSYLDIGSSCESETIRGITVENCNYSCTTDGCNVGKCNTL